jgi:hypothetical protein
VPFSRFSDCEELRPDHTPSVIGHGSELVAASPDLLALAHYVEQRFAGRVVIARGEEINPLDWPVAEW